MHGPWALAVLYFLGLWWCYEVIRRLPRDIQEIRQLKEITRTAVIIFVWALTVVIAILLIGYARVMIREAGSFIREL
jgi:uncharacterized membrane protein SpoIIM required for sporulation